MAAGIHEVKRDRDALARAIATSGLFRGLDPEFIQRLVPHASIHRLEHGERFWSKGATAEHFHVVLRGVLELQRVVAGGETTLVAFFGPGESPAIPVTLERRPFIADSYAATHVLEILRVRAEPILEALPHDVRLANTMNRALLDHCRLTHSKIDVLAAGSVPKRLAAFLLDMSERFGDEQDDGTTHIPLHLSRHQLATYVGARVETTIRVMSSWQKQGIVETTRGGFDIPDVERLRGVLEASDAGEENAEASPRR